jgi:hypothetical protein
MWLNRAMPANTTSTYRTYQANHYVWSYIKHIAFKGGAIHSRWMKPRLARF